MKLIEASSGLMECRVCGFRHCASLQSGLDRADGITRYYRGSWQCSNEHCPSNQVPDGDVALLVRQLCFLCFSARFLELPKSLNLLENTLPKSYEKLRKQKQRLRGTEVGNY